VLWLLVLTLVGLFASFFLEKTISYDDGGLGTASFLVVFTLGLPFMVLAQIASGMSSLLTYAVGLAVGLGFYLGLDRLVSPSMAPSPALVS